MAAKRPKPVDLGEVGVSAVRGPDATGRWYWRARTTAAPRTVVWTGWATRDEAAAAAGAVVGRGLPSRAERSGPAAAPRTIADLLTRWHAHQVARAERGEIAESTPDTYRPPAQHWIHAHGDVLPSRLTRQMVADTLGAWRALGRAPRSLRLDVRVIGMAMRWGAARGWCSSIDVGKLSEAHVDEDVYVQEDYTPTADELGRILAALEVGPAGDALRIQAGTGARVGEIAALRVGSLRDDVLILHGRAKGRTGKTGARPFPVAGPLLALLRRLVDGRPVEDALLDLGRRPLHEIQGALDRAAAAAGVHRCTTHALRRRAVMDLLDVADVATVARLTGHSIQTLLTSYVRRTVGDLRDVVRRARLGSGARPVLRIADGSEE